MDVTLRPATWADRHLLYRWRRDEETTADWWNGTPVTLESHCTWLRKMLDSPAVHIWIAEAEAGQRYDPRGNLKATPKKDRVQPVGMARLDSNGELSFSVEPLWRGQGVGSQIVSQAVMLAPVDRIKANADKANQAGIRTMQRAGFKIRDDVIFLRWPQ